MPYFLRFNTKCPLFKELIVEAFNDARYHFAEFLRLLKKGFHNIAHENLVLTAAGTKFS